MARVSVTIENHIAHVTLTRGDKMNALDPQMIEEIIAAGESLMDSKARVVVLSGEGKAFCAGLDLMSFAQMGLQNPEEWLMARDYGDANQVQQVAMVWRRLPMPVIAAIKGVAFGGGLQLALGADIRIAAPDAAFSVMEMKWGIVPDMGGMVLLPRLLRSDVLRRLTYTAEKVSAPQALDWGLVTELAEDPIARAQELATLIAGQSPAAIRAAKALIETAEVSTDRAEVLLEESRVQVGLIGKPEQMEVVAAQMQKRAPKFD
ncbi:crotonase/enoyl-CoA hydratase family protein [Phaeobacter italicus]|uniref:crotonase/enoyl-CoA hydratase family protein n=1 Tax=Phaeobacter italicus TaxID=481446 RepID=UPI00242D834C|nr:crotonase/enoyl-CoA hydratase family protein [Phaeobacter italicus]MCI5099815.1 crotonase/enoyl-CoA hydratase family protein [Phaeobacter italicus]